MKILTFALTCLIAGCNASAPENVSGAVPGSVDTAMKAQSVTPPQIKANDGDAAMRSAFDECIKASGGVTPEMQSCIEMEFEHQETRLDKAYQNLLARSIGAEKAKFESEQKQWILERDSQCELDADAGGQGQRLEANECFLEMTAKRAADLEARIGKGQS